ncbi:MAG: hypothetical protein QM503_12200 [Bacteroidota bacterium]
METIKHWVNLKRNNKDYIGTDDIDSEEDLEFRLIECEFKKAKASKLKVKIIPVNGKCVSYENDEKNRNKAFRLRKLGVTVTPGENKKIKLSRQVYFPAAGSSQYKVSAHYKKKTVESKKTLEIWRRVYYQIFSMKDAAIAPLDRFKDAFEKYHIEMIEMEPAAGKNKIKSRNTIFDPSSGIAGLENESIVLRDARRKYKIQKYEPSAAAAIFVHSIATYNEHEPVIPASEVPSRIRNIFGTDKQIYEIALTGQFNEDLYLWKDLEEKEDKTNKWLMSVTLVDEEGKEYSLKKSSIEIDETSCITSHGGKKYGFNKLKVEVDPKDVGAWFRSKNIFIQLKVKVVDGFSGGYSLGDKNAVFVASKAWWSPNNSTSDELLYILNHEIGHMIGMVSAGDSVSAGLLPDGSRAFAWIDNKSPNAPPNIYGQYYEGNLANNQGHQGPHCEKGATYNAADNTWSGTPECVMFGATGMTDTTSGIYKESPATFCDDCGKIVLKLNLDGSLIDAFNTRF